MESDSDIQGEAEGGGGNIMFVGFADLEGEDRDQAILNEDSDIEFAPNAELFVDSDSDVSDDSDNDTTDDNGANNDIDLDDTNGTNANAQNRQTRNDRNRRQERSRDNNGIDGEEQSGDEEQDKEDDVIKAILAASKTPRTHPPDINIDDFVVDLSFHPDEDILAAATMSGDAIIYKYSVDENTLVNTLELHTKAIRDIEFSLDGSILYSASKDKSILLTDLQTGKYKQCYEQAHEQPISKMLVFDENLFATGDDDGTIKLWDIRQRTTVPVFSLKEVDDYITSLLTNDAKKILLATSGDGYLTAINISARYFCQLLNNI